MRKILVLLAVLLAGFLTCEAQSKTPTRIKKTKSGRIAWRLMVDFKSRGGGIDNNTYDALMNYTAKHPKKPAYNVIEKGREGEKKVYYGLAELTEDEQYAFVQEVQKMIPDRKKVVTETTLPKRKNIPGLTTASTVTSTAVTDPAETKYRLIVSFISKGAGIDLATEARIKKYIETHPKMPAHVEKGWGREGEKDYLLTLTEFNADEQKLFVEEVKKLITSPDMVFIKENEAYKRQGR